MPRLEHYSEPAEGVAIELDRDGTAIFAIPFPNHRFHRAEILDEATVVFIGGMNAPFPQRNGLLLALYDVRTRRYTRRNEFPDVTGSHYLVSRDRDRLFAAGSGIAVIDLQDLSLVKLYKSYSLDGAAGRVIARPPGMEERQTGGTSIFVQFAYLFSEARDGRLVLVEQMPSRSPPVSYPLVQRALAIDTESDGLRARVLLRTDGVGSLSVVDPRAELTFVSSRQVAIFRAFAPLPETAGTEGLWRHDVFGLDADSEQPRDRYGLALHLWRFGEVDARPITVVVRMASAAAWKAGLETNRFFRPEELSLRDEALGMLDALPQGACAEDDARWSLAARNFIYSIVEDPHDGRMWITFADDALRSLDGEGRLGPLIMLEGAPSTMYGPSLTFGDHGLITVMRFPRSGPGLYQFRSTQFDEVEGPVSIEPVNVYLKPERHSKGFTAFARRQTRKLLRVPDWSRESCASALNKQAATMRKGFGDMVVASNQRLNFAYRVGKTTLSEEAFFAGIVEREVAVAPELAILLSTYLGALGAGGEGVQPWQDPDEGVGGLGAALRALALLDPDCLDVLRAYLETRDGEHEGYCLDVVVPAFFERHGWRDAEAVRFGIYATLNRFWGGRHPPEGFDGMRTAMLRHLTPGEASEAIKREAEHFGRKPDWGYGAGAYRAAFCSLLNPSDPFEAAVLDVIADDPAEA